MAKIRLIRKGDGRLFRSKQNQYVFEKSGVHFALTQDELEQLAKLTAGIMDGSLEKIDPTSPEMAYGE